MNWLRIGGLSMVILGLVGYGLGVARWYPGRSFSIAAVMVGLTLLGIHRLEAAGNAQ